MDNNNPTAQNPAVAPTPVSSQPAPVPTTPPVKEGDSKMALWLVGGLIAVIVVVGLIYWYLGSRSTKEVSKPLATPTPVTQKETSLEEDLDAVQVGDLEAEFSQVDKDLESL